MKPLHLLAVAGALGAGWYYYGDRVGLRKLDTSERGRSVVLEPGKTYELTIAVVQANAQPVTSPRMVEIQPGVRAVLVPDGTNQLKAIIVPQAAFGVTIGQGIGDESSAEVQVTRVRELPTP